MNVSLAKLSSVGLSSASISSARCGSRSEASSRSPSPAPSRRRPRPPRRPRRRRSRDSCSSPRPVPLRSVLARSVLARSVLARSVLARSVPLRSTVPRSVSPRSASPRPASRASRRSASRRSVSLPSGRTSRCTSRCTCGRTSRRSVLSGADGCFISRPSVDARASQSPPAGVEAAGVEAAVGRCSVTARSIGRAGAGRGGAGCGAGSEVGPTPSVSASDAQGSGWLGSCMDGSRDGGKGDRRSPHLPPKIHDRPPPRQPWVRAWAGPESCESCCRCRPRRTAAGRGWPGFAGPEPPGSTRGSPRRSRRRERTPAWCRRRR